jgi:hypothetical protein
MADSKHRDAPMAAEEYASEVREPAGYRLSDAALREQVLRSLARQEGLGRSAIAVEVADGTVTLSGSVRDCTDMQNIEQLACMTEGVRLVRNHLQPAAPPAPAPAPALNRRPPAGGAPKMGKPGYES